MMMECATPGMKCVAYTLVEGMLWYLTAHSHCMNCTAILSSLLEVWVPHLYTSFVASQIMK